MRAGIYHSSVCWPSGSSEASSVRPSSPQRRKLAGKKATSLPEKGQENAGGRLATTRYGAAAQARDGSSYSPGSQEPGRAGSRVAFSPTRNDPCKKFRTSGIFRCGRYDKRCSSEWWRKNSSLSASLRPPHPPRHSGHLSATRKGQLMKTVQPGQAPASAAGRAHEDGKARAGTGECRG
ncbi:uncharacterized protein LOC118432535 [Branchiostoma floridae]|uniref:Uncharacterized protein LOC118432535 n=1 Tax=Branchiostoma floridae TaxID=7739 RepID=A0A9J7MF08_BRAFL|nr:uncharacterized protein LOC118432535 [Branchiostoma floridae]